ncbi:hypothetical protein [Mycolicibacterium moriokaense]|uniref:Uncharacterized protein n=1 Tax=Mycolicibacterium moriokaense TaxID=39691 RepID=A0A318HGD4_9MYCO|nr:hypothetical protein [Mycolicibacterium moriokaense]PXX06317.1 hypothetical protein C8E89_11490 [Mycolicibacterium moriokaense]
MTEPRHPLHQLAMLLDEGADQIGPRLVRRFIESWYAGVVFEPLASALSTAGKHC